MTPHGVRIVLIRHGERDRDLPAREDSKQPLTEKAARKAHRLGERFAALSITPDVILTSKNKHAEQTADALAAAAATANPTRRSVESLTPGPGGTIDSGSHWADELFKDLYDAVSSKAGASTVFLVGHHPRLSQLLLRFAGKRQRQLGALEAVCVSAADFAALWVGCGKIDWRYPVQNWLEEELREKLTSKMTVATFLASANFVGLLELLINKQKELALVGEFKPLMCDAGALNVPFRQFCSLFPYLTPLSFLLLSLAAGLFIATLYLYDRLGMPSGFWLLRRPWWISPSDAEGTELLELHGYPQAHMIRIWTHVFTPGVICSFAGLTLLVLATGTLWLLAAYLAISFIAVLYFLWNRPTGDAD
jgi:phosphohistidine phosphatase SixA